MSSGTEVVPTTCTTVPDFQVGQNYAIIKNNELQRQETNLFCL
jgi:hypothetical protein